MEQVKESGYELLLILRATPDSDKLPAKTFLYRAWQWLELLILNSSDQGRHCTEFPPLIPDFFLLFQPTAICYISSRGFKVLRPQK